MEYILLILFGILTGITSSLFGFGGGFIVVPLIFHLISRSQYSMQVAVATSLSIMIINSIMAIYKHHQKGNILWKYAFPISYYIAIGSIVGAIIASKLPGNAVRILFIIYISYVIANCFIRKEFITQLKNTKQLTHTQSIYSGISIGAIAVGLGIGGSILTVPLMRKLGLAMKHAVALANPLSLPVAISGSVVYAMIGMMSSVHLGKLYVGFIYLPAVVLFALFGCIGVPIGAKLTTLISDKAHAQVYVLLLCATLAAMLFG